MSTFAIMHLLCPPVLEFDRERETDELKFNLKCAPLTIDRMDIFLIPSVSIHSDMKYKNNVWNSWQL